MEEFETTTVLIEANNFNLPTGKKIVVDFTPVITGSNGQMLFPFTKSVALDNDGKAEIDLPAPVRYKCQLRGDNWIRPSFNFNLLPSNNPISLDVLFNAGLPELPPPAYRVMDDKIAAHIALPGPHPQYLTETESDARHYTKSQSDTNNANARDAAISTLRAGVAEAGDNLAKLNTRLTAQEAIVGGSTPDGDDVVNRLTELYTIFQDFSDSANLINRLVNLEGEIGQRARKGEALGAINRVPTLNTEGELDDSNITTSLAAADFNDRQTRINSSLVTIGDVSEESSGTRVEIEDHLGEIRFFGSVSFNGQLLPANPVSYQSYLAEISQVGGFMPTIERVISNTLFTETQTNNLSFQRSGNGYYQFVAPSGSIPDQAVPILYPNFVGFPKTEILETSFFAPDVVDVFTYDTLGITADGLLNKTLFEIRYYPPAGSGDK